VENVNGLRKGKRIKKLLTQNMLAGELKDLISCFRLEVVLKGVLEASRT